VLAARDLTYFESAFFVQEYRSITVMSFRLLVLHLRPPPVQSHNAKVRLPSTVIIKSQQCRAFLYKPREPMVYTKYPGGAYDAQIVCCERGSRVSEPTSWSG
jgi:hypothetical protein